MNLTDDFGIWQHTDGDNIDKKHGYSLDDAARGLVLAIGLGLENEAKVYLEYIRLSLKHKSNFFDQYRRPIKFFPSEDALGQSIWALSLAMSRGFMTEKAESVLKEVDKIDLDGNIRGLSYSILGLVHTDLSRVRHFVSQINKKIADHSAGHWYWPEKSLTYGNAIMPLSLMEAAHYLHDQSLLDSGLRMLNFLNRTMKKNKLPIAIGNKGWYQKGEKKAFFDQQPIDPAYQVLANKKAFSITKEEKYRLESESYYKWFWGHNIVGLPLVSKEKGSCSDGITAEGISLNSGAESVICYLMAEESIND